MNYKNLRIIGTSHIAIESVNEIRRAVSEEKPDLIAVELDRHRLHGLLEHKKSRFEFRDMFKLGVKGYLFAIVASYLQKKLGRSVGLEPGSDMLEAVKLAKQTDVHLALIDQDISITLRNFGKAFTWKEKWHLIVDIFMSVFFNKREMAKIGITNLDLNKVPTKKVITMMLKHVQERYPSIYKALIQDRNYVMARHLSGLMSKHQKIVAVVGAGHEEEIITILKKIDSGRIEFAAQ